MPSIVQCKLALSIHPDLQWGMSWNETEHLKKRFQVICDVDWDEMSPTETEGVRSCARCDKAVFATPTEAAFNHHAALGHGVFAPTTGEPWSQSQMVRRRPRGSRSPIPPATVWAGWPR